MKEEKEYRSTTKGRYATVQVTSPSENLIKDRQWLQKANPEAAQEEKRYLAKDLYYLNKRRYQRILKEMLCEQAAGINVTKMPEAFVKK